MPPHTHELGGKERTGSDRRTFLKSLALVVPLGQTRSRTVTRPQSRTQLELLGTHPIDGATEVVTQDQYAYVAVSGSYKETPVNAGGFVVVDWTKPTEPRTVYSRTFGAPLTPDAPPHLSIDTQDVKVSGDVAGLANAAAYPGGVAFFDVSDPKQPEHVSFYDVRTESRWYATVPNFFIDGEYAYVGVNADTPIDSDGDGQPEKRRPFGEAGVDIVDVSDPTTPTRVSTWKLKEFPGPAFAKAGVNEFHDVYVQDGLAYVCFWDAGIVVLDVSDPTAPELTAHFGEAPEADTEVRPIKIDESLVTYFKETGILARQVALPGNTHYVQPSPDGRYVYVGAEAVGRREPGGIAIWDGSDLGRDVSDLGDLLAGPNRIGHIAPPDIELSKANQEYLDATPVLSRFNPRDRALIRSPHNFDVTTDRLYTSWYGGGVRVFDTTDPRAPTEIGVYDPEGASFWTAVAADKTIVASDIGTGLVFLENP